MASGQETESGVGPKRLSFGEVTVSSTPTMDQVTGKQQNETEVHRLQERPVHTIPADQPVKARVQVAESRRVLEELTLDLNRFLEVQAVATQAGKEGSVSHLERVKEQFSRFKYEYIELDTKEHFVRRVAQGGDQMVARGGDEGLTEVLGATDKASLLEQVVEGQKADVQGEKEGNQLLTQNMEVAIQEAAEVAAQLQAEDEALAQTIASCEDAIGRWEAAEAALQAAANDEDVNELDNRSRLQATQLQQLQEAEDKLTKDALQREHQLAQMKGEVEAAQLQAAEAEASVMEAERLRENAARAVQTKEWYLQLLQIVEHVSGLTITCLQPGVIKLRVVSNAAGDDDRAGQQQQQQQQLDTQGAASSAGSQQQEPRGASAALEPPETELTIALDPGSKTIMGVTVTHPNIATADILAAMRGTRQYDSVAREVQHRLAVYARRTQYLKQASAQSGYMLEYSEELVAATLPSGTSLFLRVPNDWPAPGIPLQITECFCPPNSPTGGDQAMAPIIENLNKGPEAAAGQLLPLLSAVERAVMELARGAWPSGAACS